MSHIRFNRHEIFGVEDHKFHSQTIREVEDCYLSQDKNPWSFNEVANSLYGIWDGYLYDNIIEEAMAEGLPESLVDRIKTTVTFIKKELGK